MICFHQKLSSRGSFDVRMKKRVFLFLLCLLLVSSPAHAAQYRVVAVADGDTITVEPVQGGDRASVRLQGIDAPEMNQPYGRAARAFVIEAVLHKEVKLTSHRKDKYGRIVALVEIPGVGILQELLLDAGLAWVWPQYCRNCRAWEAMQRQARRQKKGLWADDKPVEPWEWRKRR